MKKTNKKIDILIVVKPLQKERKKKRKLGLTMPQLTKLNIL